MVSRHSIYLYGCPAMSPALRASVPWVRSMIGVVLCCRIFLLVFLLARWCLLCGYDCVPLCSRYYFVCLLTTVFCLASWEFAVDCRCAASLWSIASGAKLDIIICWYWYSLVLVRDLGQALCLGTSRVSQAIRDMTRKGSVLGCCFKLFILLIDVLWFGGVVFGWFVFSIFFFWDFFFLFSLIFHCSATSAEGRRRLLIASRRAGSPDN